MLKCGLISEWGSPTDLDELLFEEVRQREHRVAEERHDIEGDDDDIQEGLWGARTSARASESARTSARASESARARARKMARLLDERRRFGEV